MEPSVADLNYLHCNLLRSEKCLTYLRERRVSLAAAHKYCVGYYDDNEFSQYFDRMVFPVRDQYGTLLTLQGRAMYDWKSANRPKYWHGKFDGKEKHEVVYGLFECAEQVVKANAVVIVEGPFDVMACYQCGVPAVAMLSTNISREQAVLLRRYAKYALLWPDNDEAGMKHLEGITKQLECADMYVKILEHSFPEKDTADIYLQHGRQGVRDVIGS